MNREIYSKIREFSVDMYTQGFSDGYTDGSTKGVEVEKAQEYKRGFENGYSQGWDKAYEKGLKDAWEAARKIIEMGEYERKYNVFTKCDDGEYPFVKYTAAEAIYNIKEYEERKKHCRCIKCNHYDEEQSNIFCERCVEFSEYEEQHNSTEQGCDTYESAQNEDKCVDDEIRVGDEVIMYDNYKGTVISMPYGDSFNVLSEDGNVWTIYERGNITKTGRNFAQIAEALNQLKEEIKQ